MKFSLLLSFGVMLWVGTTHAQEPLALDANLAVKDSKVFDEAKRVVLLTQLWSMPLDWSETESSTADIVAHLTKALGNDAPIIEMRGKDSNRSTFVLKGVSLGPTLTAVADLTNMAVWVFPERLLLAPESALSPAERSAIKEGLGGEWKQSSAARGKEWNPRQAMEKIGVSIVGNEVKARLAAKGVNVPTQQPAGESTVMGGPQSRPAFELPFGELSPPVQTVLQDMLNLRYGNISSRPASKIEASAIVSFDDTAPYQTDLRLQSLKADAPSGRQELGRWFVNKALPPFPRPTN